MKNLARILLMAVAVFLFIPSQANSQILKKLKNKAEKAAERKLEKKVERETEKTMDSILDPDSKAPSSKPTADSPTNAPEDSPIPSNTTKNGNSGLPDLEVISKFDFVPGDKILFLEDFSQDFVGDFPSRWNTNGSGEIIAFNDDSGNWFEMKSGYKTYFIPYHPKLPEDYTIEFDLETKGIDEGTKGAASIDIIITNTNDFSQSKTDFVRITIPIAQYMPGGIAFRSIRNDGQQINNRVKADLRDAVKERPHIAIAVNRERFRMYLNETKYLDVPKMIAPNSPMTTLKFQFLHARDGIDRAFIKNVKIAEGGVDLRKKLMEDGKLSTNGILFDSGSANIKSQSYGILKQISQVLQQDSYMKLNIIGHTDSDGSEDINLKLSQDRAKAVMDALIKVYGIEANRLSSDGKGAHEPVADNASLDGKAQNRRVEFVKM